MIRVVGLILFIGLGIWASRRFVPSLPAVSSSPTGIPVTTVKRGPVTFTIVAQGELQGGNTQMLQTPMTGGQPVTITFLRQNGELVQPGDQVVRFDTTEQEFRLREAEADLAEAEQQIIQATSEAEAKEEETRCELIKAEGEFRAAEVEMRRNEIVAKLLAHENELALEAARQKRAKLKEDLKNRLETGRSGIEMQHAARAKAEVKARTARNNIESMTLRAKASGYVAVQQNDEGNLRWGMYLPPYQVGDIARPGKAVAQIPDMSSWEATARISELDRGHIAEGQPAEISVVALPGKRLQGKIKTIGGTTGPPWDRHFDCRVALQAPIRELRPGMTVELRIVTGNIQDALWIPAQALFEAEGRKYVYKGIESGFKPQDVKMVRRNESQVVVEDLAEGTVVALANPDQTTRKQPGGGALQALPNR
jgi:multidrug efflux pump subunit AcrA (membrane-fusion protein)